MANQKPMLFGNVHLDASAIEDLEKFEGQGFDNSYVPGYSEQRQLNELAVRRGEKEKPIDRLYWARVSRIDGTNVDYREATTVSRLGYRACTVEDLKARGWGMPPGAHVGSDGLIRREDTALAIVDNDRATRNKKRQREVNAEFEGRSVMPDSPRGITAAEGYLENQRTGASLRQAAEDLLA